MFQATIQDGMGREKGKVMDLFYIFQGFGIYENFVVCPLSKIFGF